MLKGEKAPDNPWDATSLEWSIPSPPPFDNFDGKHPVVYRGPNEYGTPSGEKDFEMQATPPAEIQRRTI
jgi:cytochrome c oxidase subunit 1